MKKVLSMTVLSLLLMVGVSFAASFTFNGNIAYHNDIVDIDFTLTTDATNVTVWTDSYMGGTNFDPITAVWKYDGAQWDLVGENDDNASLWAGQTSYDSGLFFSTLTAGMYKFTIATYNNFAKGSVLADGFDYDGQTPVPLSVWDQPANHVGMGTYYRVNLDGVDSAVNNSAVPVPGTILLLGFGLLSLTGINRKK